jgi:hypothetical protein
VAFEVRSGEVIVIELPPRDQTAAPVLEGPVRRAFEGVIAFPIPASPIGEIPVKAWGENL